MNQNNKNPCEMNGWWMCGDWLKSVNKRFSSSRKLPQKKFSEDRFSVSQPNNLFAANRAAAASRIYPASQRSTIIVVGICRGQMHFLFIGAPKSKVSLAVFLFLCFPNSFAYSFLITRCSTVCFCSSPSILLFLSVVFLNLWSSFSPLSSFSNVFCWTQIVTSE